MTVGKLSAPQAVSPMDLVHADGFDSAYIAVGKAPLHEPLHRPVHHFPTGLESPRRFQPTQPPRPTRQKSHHGQRHRTLAVTPRNMLHGDAVFGALQPPWRIPEIRFDSPERHKQPASLGQPVVARSRFTAVRTSPADALMRFNENLDRWRQLRRTMHLHTLVDEAHETLHLIEDGFNLELNS